ncbi:MAG: DNA-processing protein DprA [Aggregatilineales bacterium]
MKFSSEDLLRLHSVPGIGGRTLRKVLAWAVAEEAQLTDVFTLDADELKLRFGLKTPVIDALHASSVEHAAALAESLADQGVQLITSFDDFVDPGYPLQIQQRLGDSAPSLLYVKGDLKLLALPGVAFSGSRHTSEEGIQHTMALAADAVKANFTVISGHAPGTDAAAHQVALMQGGVTVLVLPEGMLRFRLRPELRDGYDLHPDNAVIVSEFPPNVPWSAQNAMIRNQMILGLAQALCVIEAGDTGGTLDAGERALKLKMPVFVLDYSDLPASATGNQRLIEQGAQPISVNPRPTLPPIPNVPSAAESDTRRAGQANSPAHPLQPKLF